MTSKRWLDVVLASIILAVGAVPLLLAAAAVRLSSGSPILFRQVRIGRNALPFMIYKLRTMRAAPNSPSITIAGTPRITPLGHFLRMTKIDELPQLINVLKGEMSLVGPRPEVPEYVARYSEEDKKIIFSAKPGLTDFASIRFRNENRLLASQTDPLAYYERILLPAKLRYYRFYVQRARPSLDLYILALTGTSLLRDLFSSISTRTKKPPGMASKNIATVAAPISALRRTRGCPTNPQGSKMTLTAQELQSPPHRLRSRCKALVDYIALAAVASIPWSTSATSILVTAWILALLPTTTITELRAEALKLRSLFPVLLAVLGLLGMLWADVSWGARVDGVISFCRFIFIPVFSVYFARSSAAGRRALVVFLISCGIILIVSLSATWYPAVVWWRPGYPVVPFKDATTQSLEFALCGLGLIAVIGEARLLSLKTKVGAALLAGLFIADIIYVATSRTELVAILVTMPVLAVRRWGLRGIAAGVLGAALLSLGAWYSSANIRERIAHGIWEYQRYETLDQGTSIGARLEFWKRSLLIISEAPVLGHGTGSIEQTFAKTVSGTEQWVGESRGVGTHVARTMVTPNPHNQAFAVGIQLGLVGIALLFGMWAVQLEEFRGPGLLNALGMITMIQFIVGSIFYSYLFDFTEAWIFIAATALFFGVRTRESHDLGKVTVSCPGHCIRQDVPEMPWTEAATH